MKLILTHEVENLGAPGDVVEVKDGYGRNFLLPRGLAMRWTRGAAKQIDSMKRARAVREVRDRGHAEEIKLRLEAQPVTIRARAGAGGRLFGSVTVADVAAAVKAGGGPEVDRRRVEIGAPIKTVGSHQVRVRLHPEVVAVVPLDVVPA